MYIYITAIDIVILTFDYLSSGEKYRHKEKTGTFFKVDLHVAGSCNTKQSSVAATV